MDSPGIAILAAFVVVYSLVSRRVDHGVLTGPIVFTAFGFLVGPAVLDIVDLGLDDEVVHLAAELTLVLVLFTDASRIDLRVLHRNRQTPERLLLVGLPLTILAGLGAGALLFPDLGFWAIATLAVILAPTDAALGEAVVSNRKVPLRVRQALNVESGLNDGICVPLLAVCLAFAGGDAEVSFWGSLVEALGFGVLAGVGIGLLAARLIDRAWGAGWVISSFGRLAIAVVPVLAFSVAELLHGSGFIAAFVAGLAVGSTTRDLGAEVFDFAEDAGNLMGVLTWIIFGGALVGTALGTLTPVIALYAVLSLTAFRMLPVAVSLLGTGFSSGTRVFMGWFGPRGLASIVFAITVFEDGALADGELIKVVATWTVLLSVLAHGLTATAGADWYGRRWAAGAEDDAAEFRPVEELRPRTLARGDRR